MSQLELIRLRRFDPTFRGRLAATWESLRSWTLGPWSTKDKALAKAMGGRETSAGVPVNEQSALTVSAVWCAVNLIASHLGSLPLPVYRRQTDGGKTRSDGHPLYRLLHDRPNPFMTSITFRETLQAHALLWGNGYAEIERDMAGRPIALWPLPPYNVQPYFETGSGQLRYRVWNPSGTQVDLSPLDIFHIRGLGDDGICGYSVIAKARESLGLGIAAERFGATFFGNGSTFGGVISYPPGVGNNTATRKENREAIEKVHTGVDRAHRFLALYEGAKYERIGIPPEDAQFLETRQFQVTEIARWFNIPPHKLKDLERATFSNIEHQSIEYVSDCLLPWLRRWEGEIVAKLILPAEQSTVFAEFLVEGLLRGDAATRAAFYKTMTEIGAMTLNEVRARENLNPLPGGDVARIPMNTVPLRAEPSNPDERNAAPGHRTALLAAHREVLVDGVRRVLMRHVNRIQKARSTPPKLRAWIESYLDDSVQITDSARSMEPGLRAWLLVTGSDANPTDASRVMAAVHCAELKTHLLRVVALEGGEIYEEALEHLLRRYEDRGALDFVDRVMSAGFTADGQLALSAPPRLALPSTAATHAHGPVDGNRVEWLRKWNKTQAAR